MEITILTSKEAAKYLGYSLHQIYKLSSAGKIPVNSPTGGKIYFLKHELDEWILSGRRATGKDIESASILKLIRKK